MTNQLLHEYLEYDRDSGIFTWKKSFGRRMRKGVRAGCAIRGGYRVITLKNELVREHVLAWQYVNGEQPESIIDHINGIKDDNRIENLRLTDDRMNALNKAEHRGGSLPGTRFNHRDRVWEARINIKGRKVHLGSYHTKEEASERYMDAVRLVEYLDHEMVGRFMHLIFKKG